jgi:hypothetical protein
MDGGKVASRIHAGVRRTGALLAVSAAMIPVAFLSAGEGAHADEAPASSRYAVGSTAMVTAQEIARSYWGTEACGGAVDIVWGNDDLSINARSYWANPKSAYDHPELNEQCRIVFNGDLDFSWEKFCSVFVHEYGHLVGKPHAPDGPDVMSPIYRRALPVCAATPDPAGPAAEPAVVVEHSDSVIDAPVQKSRGKRSKARRVKARSKARARAAVAPDDLPHFTSAGHDH